MVRTHASNPSGVIIAADSNSAPRAAGPTPGSCRNDRSNSTSAERSAAPMPNNEHRSITAVTASADAPMIAPCGSANSESMRTRLSR